MQTALAIGAIALAVVATGAPAVDAAPIASVRGLDQDVLAEVNAVRREHGLVPLAASRSLVAAASSHSREMARHGFFAHESADGTDPVSRIQRFYTRRGYREWWVGENLFWYSQAVDARQVVAAWLASPSHRRQLLTARYREAGVSALHVDSAPGAFRGLSVTIVTIDFGTRRR